MKGSTTAILLLALFKSDYSAQASDVVEIHKENCTDPNAELRYDNKSCVVTCTKKTLSENPAFCYGKPELKKDCYCKQHFKLDETTNKCVPQEKCPCDKRKNEISKYSNNCANGCATFHTLTYCSGLLYSQCWCIDTFCKNDNGTCVAKE